MAPSKGELCPECHTFHHNKREHYASQEHSERARIVDAEAGGFRPIEFGHSEDAEIFFLFMRKAGFPSVFSPKEKRKVWLNPSHLPVVAALGENFRLECEAMRDQLLEKFLHRVKEACLQAEGVGDLSPETDLALMQGKLELLKKHPQ